MQTILIILQLLLTLVLFFACLIWAPRLLLGWAMAMGSHQWHKGNPSLGLFLPGIAIALVIAFVGWWLLPHAVALLPLALYGAAAGAYVKGIITG